MASPRCVPAGSRAFGNVAVGRPTARTHRTALLLDPDLLVRVHDGTEPTTSPRRLAVRSAGTRALGDSGRCRRYDPERRETRQRGAPASRNARPSPTGRSAIGSPRGSSPRQPFPRAPLQREGCRAASPHPCTSSRRRIRRGSAPRAVRNRRSSRRHSALPTLTWSSGVANPSRTNWSRLTPPRQLRTTVGELQHASRLPDTADPRRCGEEPGHPRDRRHALPASRSHSRPRSIIIRSAASAHATAFSEVVRTTSNTVRRREVRTGSHGGPRCRPD